MTSHASDIRAPAEQLPITLFDAVVLAVRADDGTISLGIRDVCQALTGESLSLPEQSALDLGDVE